MKTGFFDYYHRRLAEGLSETAAYKWAITEDMWSADDEPLTAQEATADGMCYHPESALTRIGHALCCDVCGLVMQNGFDWRPVKVLTRREQAVLVFQSGEGKTGDAAKTGDSQ